MPIKPLKLSFCQLCVQDFKERPSQNTWNRMIDALVTRGNIARKFAIKSCEAKFGKQFSSENI